LQALITGMMLCNSKFRERPRRIHVQHRSSETSRRLESVPGIGAIGATAIAASQRSLSIFWAESSRPESGWYRDKTRPAVTSGWPDFYICVDYSSLVPLQC
jgi:transposase